jgi:hypothetical protein
MPPVAKPKDTVDRKIHFYRAVLPIVKGQAKAFDPTTALARINGLAFASPGRYLQDGDRILCCWVTKAEKPGQARLAVIRREGLPSVEEGGHEKDLALAATAGLIEQIHIRCFAQNIVGCDFNFYGPRLPAFARYLAALGGQPALKHLDFHALVRQDVVAMLDEYGGVRAWNLQVRRSDIEAISKIDKSLGDALKAQAKLGAAELVEVALRVKPYARGETLGAGAFARIKKLARRKDIADLVGQFTVDAVPADGGRSATLNILDDHLITTKPIKKRAGRGRALDHASAFDAIGDAYHDLKEELSKAASVAVKQQKAASAGQAQGGGSG